MSKTANIKMICLTGMFMALICIATLFFKVPIPLGYAHLGNGFIFLAGAFLANPYALIAALIIKCIMGAVIAGIAANGKVASLRTFAAVVVGMLEMIAGYTIAGAILYGSVAAGLSQIPGLTAEGIVGIILFYAVGMICEKTGVKKYFTQVKTA